MNIYSFKIMLIIIKKISEKDFNSIASKEQDEIWNIFKRMRSNPNLKKLTTGK